jgi:hypothetical protein
MRESQLPAMMRRIPIPILGPLAKPVVSKPTQNGPIGDVDAARGDVAAATAGSPTQTISR